MSLLSKLMDEAAWHIEAIPILKKNGLVPSMQAQPSAHIQMGY
jgi:hypothetical protein